MPIIGGWKLLVVGYIVAHVSISKPVKHWWIRWVWSGLSAGIRKRWILSWRWRRSWLVTSPIPGLVLVSLVWWSRFVIFVSINVVIWTLPSLRGSISTEVVITLIIWWNFSSCVRLGGWHHSPIIIDPGNPIPRSVGRSTSFVVVMGERNFFLSSGFIQQLLDVFVSYLLSAVTRSMSIGSTIPAKRCSILSSFLVRVNQFLDSFYNVYSVFLQLSS